MATRTMGLVDFHLAEDVLSDPIRLPAILDWALPECRQMDVYWRLNDPWYDLESIEAWRLQEHQAATLNGSQLGGPGGLSVLIYPRVADIGASTRWRGLLTIPELRRCTRAALRAIGRALGGTRILIAPDYAGDLLLDPAVEESASLDQLIELIHQQWGPPQPAPDLISPKLIADCEHCPPSVWFLEEIWTASCE